ncbi:MAG: hypothetical protein KDA87_22000 [Planctomycetales bacterium]|nr:hypothetical protein [Planctomycetales bacterium]
MFFFDPYHFRRDAKKLIKYINDGNVPPPDYLETVRQLAHETLNDENRGTRIRLRAQELLRFLRANGLIE